MSGADRIARALNSWASEGLDMGRHWTAYSTNTSVRMTTKLQEVSIMNNNNQEVNINQDVDIA